MQEQQQQYERQSECEDYADYKPQGYHPVTLGQKFDGKYVVHQKLGWGHFSTVWLVHNELSNEYGALKIQRSKDTHAETAVDELQMLKRIRQHQKDEQWVQLVKKMQNQHPKLVSSKLCRPLALLDNFSHHGIHGKHHCTVFELMGPNLLDLIQHYEFKDKRMPLWLVKKITIDVLLGLVHLHDFSGLIHTDLKPENIMMKLHPDEQSQLIQKVKQYKVKPISMKYLRSLETSKSSKNRKKYEKKKLKKKKKNEGGQVQVESKQIEEQNEDNFEIIKTNDDSEQKDILKRKEGQNSENKTGEEKDQREDDKNKKQEQKKQRKQKEEQQNEEQDKQKVDMSILKWKNVSIKLNPDIFYKIADMGNACDIKKHFTEDIQTREYRSPEVILGHYYEPNTDIWSLACTIFQLMTNSFLFKPKRVQGISKDQNHLYKMIEILGNIPKEFATEGTDSAKYFNKKGKLLHGNPKQQISLSTLLFEDYDYTKEQAYAAEKFLLPMLEYLPKNRISARKCLQNPWLWQS